jgi:hypothetical protein
VEHEPAAMAAAIEQLMVDDALHQRLSTQAETYARANWSLGPSVDRLEQRLLRLVVAARGDPAAEQSGPDERHFHA